MTKTGSLPKPDSTSSEQADDSGHSDAILALGRKLVVEHSLEPSVDTLGRWMAHYIASLVANAQRATDEEKGPAEKRCFEAILAFWRHRMELPNGRRPYEELEPVARAIESLDPEDETPRYYRSVRAASKDREDESEVAFWLDMVSGLDYSAKILIGYCLGEAAGSAIDKSKGWVKLAEAAGAEDGVPEIVIRFVSTNRGIGKEPDLNTEARRQLQNRIEKLEGFIGLAEALARDLKARLEALPPSKGDDDETPEDHIFISAAPAFPPDQ